MLEEKSYAPDDKSNIIGDEVNVVFIKPLYKGLWIMLSQRMLVICPNGKKLYAVSTYYHVLTGCAKKFVHHENVYFLVIWDIPDGLSLANRIEQSGLFDMAYYIDRVEEYKLDYIFSQHRKNAVLIKRQLPFLFMDYKEINIFHDDIWVSRCLMDRQIKYRLIEGSIDSFKTISKICFAYMLSKSRIKTAVKKLFEIGYVFCGFEELTAE